MIRAQVWDEQALLDVMVDDLLYSLPPPKDGVLHVVPDKYSCTIISVL